MRGSAQELQSPHIDSVTSWSVVSFVDSEAKILKGKRSLGYIPYRVKDCLKKIYSPYEDLNSHPQTLFRYLIYMFMLLVLLDQNHAFKDTRMRKSMPPGESKL